MKAAKIGLLFLILLCGATVETAWEVRDHIDLGPVGCRVLGGRFYGPSWSFEAEESRSVAARTPVEVTNAFGAVKVVAGEPGAVVVRIRKVVFRPTEGEAREYAERIRLLVTDEGGRIRVATNREPLEQERRGQRQIGFETHLEVSVPADTPLTVRNDHGAVQAAGVAEADLAGSYDDVRAERIAGALKVDVRHGGAEVLQVHGPLVLVGRHGDVQVEDVKEPVDVQVEHGSISLARVGRAKVSTTHGHIKADGVAGDLDASVDHGGVEATQIAGNAVIASSYDDIELRSVDGEARLVARHGGVTAEDVQGAVHAEASYDDVRLLRIGKDVDVTVDHGGVEAEDLAGAARVTTSGDDVTLKNFASSVEIEADRGSVELTPAGPIAHALSVRTRHGGITLRVPAGSGLDVEAASAEGELDIDVPGWSAQRTEGDRTFGRVGAGGVAVKLAADRGDVRVLGSVTETAEARPEAPATTPSPARAVGSSPAPATRSSERQ